MPRRRRRECPDVKRLKNEFLYKISPENLIVPNNGSLIVSIRPTEQLKGEQIVIIQLVSYLFEILDPSANSGIVTQVYGIYGKDDTINFRISMRNLKKIQLGQTKVFLETLEGVLSVKHGFLRDTSEEDLDTEEMWEKMKKPGSTLMQNEVKMDKPWGEMRINVFVENEEIEEIKVLKMELSGILEKRKADKKDKSEKKKEEVELKLPELKKTDPMLSGGLFRTFPKFGNLQKRGPKKEFVPKAPESNHKKAGDSISKKEEKEKELDITALEPKKRPVEEIVLKNEFLYKISPDQLIVPNNGSLIVTVKPKDELKGQQIVIIQLHSQLFEIMDPNINLGTITQVYGIFRKDETINIRIAMRNLKENHLDHSDDYPEKLENFLSVTHGFLRDNFEEDLDTEQMWEKMKKRGWILMKMDKPWGKIFKEVIVKNEDTDEIKRFKMGLTGISEERKGFKNDESGKNKKEKSEKKSKEEELKSSKTDKNDPKKKEFSTKAPESNHQKSKVSIVNKEDNEKDSKEKTKKPCSKTHSVSGTTAPGSITQKSDASTEKPSGMSPSDIQSRPVFIEDKKKIEMAEKKKKKKKSNPCCTIL